MTHRLNKMTCKELVELVTDYLEGTLPEQDRHRFDTHLETCEGCTNYLAQMRKTIRLTGLLTQDAITEEGVQPLLTAFRTWKQGRESD